MCFIINMMTLKRLWDEYEIVLNNKVIAMIDRGTL
jgi:hypothetical protein